MIAQSNTACWVTSKFNKMCIPFFVFPKREERQPLACSSAFVAANCSTHLPIICSATFHFVLCDLRRIRRHIPLSTAKTISNALISSRLDYCNSLLNNIAKQELSKLQRVQNCLARVVLRAPRFSPSLPLLKQLHWLPVNYRIKFKLSTLTYRALAIHQPPYLTLSG